MKEHIDAEVDKSEEKGKQQQKWANTEQQDVTRERNSNEKSPDICKLDMWTSDWKTKQTRKNNPE